MLYCIYAEKIIDNQGIFFKRKIRNCFRLCSLKAESKKSGGVKILRNGKNPNFEQKKILAANNFNWKEWLVIADRVDSYEFRKKEACISQQDTVTHIILSKTYSKNIKRGS